MHAIGPVSLARRLLPWRVVHRLLATCVAAALPWLAAACAVESDAGDECVAGSKCDSAGDVQATLEGLDDPIAEWLRTSPMTQDGRLDTDYLSAVEEISKVMGCSMDTMRSFVLSDDLVAGQPFPRVISTLCTGDDTRASEFFIAASFADPDNPDDIDVRNLEMFAWDSTARRYRFYAALPVEGQDELQIEVEVRRCTQCHLNSKSLDDDGMPMLPIMNELTRPWPHWNAEPDFPSHTFEVSEATRNAPNYSAVIGDGRLASAAVFEQIVRSGQSGRVVSARLRTRRDPGDIGAAMALLRPLFCDEQVNYAAEDFSSGVLAASTVITGGTRDMFLAVRPSDWPWQWLNSDVIRLPTQADTTRLTMMPVRGAADIEYERRLVALRALSAEQVLRVRALDWMTPVFSDLRCELWTSARQRLRDEPIDIPAGANNADLLPILYQDIMQLDGQSLLVGEPGQVLAVDVGHRRESLVNALASSSTEQADCAADGFCVVDLDGFGQLLDDRASAIEQSDGREQLAEARRTRLCRVQDDFANRPAFDTVHCFEGPPNAPRDLGAESAMDSGSFAGANATVRLIPDGDSAGVDSEIVATSDQSLTTGVALVRLAIAHSWRGDVRVMLTAPSGANAEVISFAADDSGNDIDDVYLVPFDQPIDGQGSWRLTVIDDRFGERGMLEGWSLGIGAEPPSLDAPGARTAP